MWPHTCWDASPAKREGRDLRPDPEGWVLSPQHPDCPGQSLKMRKQRREMQGSLQSKVV